MKGEAARRDSPQYGSNSWDPSKPHSVVTHQLLDAIYFPLKPHTVFTVWCLIMWFLKYVHLTRGEYSGLSYKSEQSVIG